MPAIFKIKMIVFENFGWALTHSAHPLDPRLIICTSFLNFFYNQFILFTVFKNTHNKRQKKLINIQFQKKYIMFYLRNYLIL